MSDDSQRFLLSRRQMLLLGAAGGLGAMGIGTALDEDGGDGSLYGGTMALSEAFNVAGDLWVGPDSTKSTVTAESGRMFFTSDTQLTYYGDGGSWVSLGVGTDGNEAPASYFQSLTTERVEHTTENGSAPLAIDFGGTSGSPSIVSIGFNVDANGSRLDTDHVAIRTFHEGEFTNPSGDLLSERNMNIYTAAGAAARYEAFIYNHDTDTASWAWAFDSTINFKDGETGGAGTNVFTVNSSGAFARDDMFISAGDNHRYRLFYDADISRLRFRSNPDSRDIWGINDGTPEFAMGTDILMELGGNTTNKLYKATAIGWKQRAADPTTSDLASGEIELYESDGSADVTGDAGDLIYAINDSGTIKTAIIVDASADAT